MAANVDIDTDIPTKVDLQLFHQAEQGNIHARNKLCSLANNGWVSDKGFRPIQFAAAKGLVKVFKMLAKEREQDLNLRNDDGWTLLHFAAFDGNLKVARLLVRDFK